MKKHKKIEPGIHKLWLGNKPTRQVKTNVIYQRDNFSFESQKVKVGHIKDGDTIVVHKGSKTITIRLYGIDCPESDQDWGEIARAGLIKLIGGKYVYLELFGKDSYERTLATIYVEYVKEDELILINVNEKMVAKGHAWVMRRFYEHLPKDRRAKINALENFAKNNKVGLWRADNPIPPWIWRKKMKSENFLSSSAEIGSNAKASTEIKQHRKYFFLLLFFLFLFFLLVISAI